jgi:hypothetical protein
MSPILLSVKPWLTKRSEPMATWYGYHYYVGSDKKHSGITTDPQRRQTEHQQRWPGGRLVIATQGLIEAQARTWEAQQTKTVTPEQR